MYTYLLHKFLKLNKLTVFSVRRHLTNWILNKSCWSSNRTFGIEFNSSFNLTIFMTSKTYWVFKLNSVICILHASVQLNTPRLSSLRRLLQRILHRRWLSHHKVPTTAAVFWGGADEVVKPRSVPGAGELLGDARWGQDNPTQMEPPH